MPYPTEHLDGLATAIGRSVIEWNRVEHGLISLAHRLAICLTPALLLDPKQVMYIALVNMPVRSRTAAVRAFASQCDAAPDFFERVSKLMGQIESPLHEERNRFFHDWWDAEPEGQAVRVQFKSQVSAPRGDKPKLDILGERLFASIEDVNSFSERLKQTYHEIGKLDGETCRLPQYIAAGVEEQKRRYFEALMRQAGFDGDSVLFSLSDWLERDGAGAVLEALSKVKARAAHT